MEIELEEHVKIGFFTGTILNWQTLLLSDKYKEVVLRSLEFLTKNKRVKIYAFVLMPNHIHFFGNWKNHGR